MADDANLQVVLASRPRGEPAPGNFRCQTVALPEPGDNQVLVRTRWLSLAPYLRWRMDDAPSYAPAIGIGEVLPGSTVGEVVQSRHPGFRPGDTVVGQNGWQTFALADGHAIRKADGTVPPPVLLGALGGNGLTAWGGLLRIGQPRPGETVAVAAASGGVGALVGQIARIHGARAVGIAGGPDKCRFVTEELGFDACVDHRTDDFPADLARACPDGIDVYFENVGGRVWDAVLPLLNRFARVPVCGVIAQYSTAVEPGAADRLPAAMRAVLTRSITLRGFLMGEFADERDRFVAEMSGWLHEGRIRGRDDVTDGLENAPGAFIGMLRGANFGKVLVRP